ncbi:hypothetical protein ARAM_007743 [Aspergillus rambellii]|uniref:BHLH domain-containing protein n=2 Tax=Aspergillus subgen. Nidulantes TaxID=2720870 RepID=A0A0F8U6U3_9EURO|nr:hypothetical protein ARAM_007743 [Aspergillus rambellii]
MSSEPITSPIGVTDLPSPVAAAAPQPKRKPARYSSSPEIHPQESTPTTTITTSTGTSRKISRSLSDDSARGRNAAKRAAHNIIEKRYRTNMNAKFVALEKAMSGTKNGGVSKSSSSASSSKSSASLKKSEILTNAIAYMQELQETNERLRKELASLNHSMGRRMPF